jgi:DNA-binding Lrp family transcriptional regulator
MAASAYVLVNISGPQTKGAVGKIRKIKGVTSAHIVAGPYDLVAFVEGGSQEEIGELVISKDKKDAGGNKHGYLFCRSLKVEYLVLLPLVETPFMESLLILSIWSLFLHIRYNL